MLTAAKNVHLKLFKYYNKATPLYSIISALDPHINMHYFKYKKWSRELIDDWKLEMEDIWEKNYKPSNTIDIPVLKAPEDDFLNSIYEKKQYVDVDDELE